MKEYCLEFFHGWKSLVSGVGSIVLSTLAVFDGFGFLKGYDKAFVPMAIICMIIAGFSAWRKERQRVERLDGSALLSTTPKKLVSVFNNQTTADGDDDAKWYIGKWMELTGHISDVYEPKSWWKGQAIHVLLEGSPEVILRFRRKWVDRIRGECDKGDQITVQGQIQKIDRQRVSLHRCEVRKIVPPESLEE
jgi:hypothetical protein